MWTFAGLLVVAAVVARGFWRLNRIVGAIGIVFERAINLGQIRSGKPPVTTPEDEERYR